MALLPSVLAGVKEALVIPAGWPCYQAGVGKSDCATRFLMERKSRVEV